MQSKTVTFVPKKKGELYLVHFVVSKGQISAFQKGKPSGQSKVPKVDIDFMLDIAALRATVANYLA